MAGKVFFSVTMSLDGFIAPEGRMGDPDWTAQWMELQPLPPRAIGERSLLTPGESPHVTVRLGEGSCPKPDPRKP